MKDEVAAFSFMTCCGCFVIPLALLLPLSTIPEIDHPTKYALEVFSFVMPLYGVMALCCCGAALQSNDSQQQGIGISFAAFSGLLILGVSFIVVVFMPFPTKVFPTSGPISGGTNITITGINFETTRYKKVAVFLQDIKYDANFTDKPENQTSRLKKVHGIFMGNEKITYIVPALSVLNYGTGMNVNKDMKRFVRVSTDNSTWTFGKDVFFTYYVEPTITSVSPNYIPSKQFKILTIRGTNFINDTNSKVLIRGTSVATNVASPSSTYTKTTSGRKLSLISSTEMRINSVYFTSDTPTSRYTPYLALNGKNYVVGTSGSYITVWSFLDAYPKSIQSDTPTKISIIGVNFDSAYTFEASAFLASNAQIKQTFTNVVVVNSTLITAISSPATIAGRFLLNLGTKDNNNSTVTNSGTRVAINFVATDTINPVTGPVSGKTQITVNGNGFTDNPNAFCVFRETYVPATFVSATTLLCETPKFNDTDIGVVPFFILPETGQNITVPEGFTVYRVPVVTQQVPATIPLSPVPIELIGVNFTEGLTGATARFVDATARSPQLPTVVLPLTIVSSTLLRLSTPTWVAQSSTVSFPRQAYVEVSMNGQDFDQISRFTFKLECNPGTWSSESNPTPCLICDPPSACLGGSACDAGYVGRVCGFCAKEPRKHYRLASQCVACPENDGGIGVALFSLMILIAAILFYGAASAATSLKQRMLSFSQIAIITINFVQITAVIGKLDLNWPPEVVAFIRNLLSIFLFNVDLATPECSVDIDYSGKWGLVVAIPFMILGLYSVTLLFWVIVACIRAEKDNKNWLKDAQLKEYGMDLLHSLLLFLSMGYIFLSVKTLEPFDCTRQPDGTLSLDARPAILCSDADAQWTSIFGWSIVLVLVYVIGIPLFFGAIIGWGHKHDLFDDTPMIQDENDTEAQRNFHRVFSFLYIAYKPSRWWFEITILIRKMFASIVPVFFSSRGLETAQAGILLPFLVINACFVWWSKPYLCHRLDCKTRPKFCDHNGPATRLDFFSLVANALTLFFGLISSGISPSDLGSQIFVTVCVYIIVFFVLFSVIVVLYMDHKKSKKSEEKYQQGGGQDQDAEKTPMGKFFKLVGIFYGFGTDDDVAIQVKAAGDK